MASGQLSPKALFDLCKLLSKKSPCILLHMSSFDSKLLILTAFGAQKSIPDAGKLRERTWIPVPPPNQVRLDHLSLLSYFQAVPLITHRCDKRHVLRSRKARDLPGHLLSFLRGSLPHLRPLPGPASMLTVSGVLKNTGEKEL